MADAGLYTPCPTGRNLVNLVNNFPFWDCPGAGSGKSRKFLQGIACFACDDFSAGAVFWGGHESH